MVTVEMRNMIHFEMHKIVKRTNLKMLENNNYRSYLINRIAGGKKLSPNEYIQLPLLLILQIIIIILAITTVIIYRMLNICQAML